MASLTSRNLYIIAVEKKGDKNEQFFARKK